MNLAWCVFSTFSLATSSHTMPFTQKWSHVLHTPVFFPSNICQNLRWQFWCELLHLKSQPTFAAAYKELSFWITFLPQQSILQHESIISVLFLHDQIWHILPENPQLYPCEKAHWLNFVSSAASLNWQNVFRAAQGYCPWSCKESESLTGDAA